MLLHSFRNEKMKSLYKNEIELELELELYQYKQ